MAKVELANDGGAWTLTLNRPDRRNSLDLEMVGELREAVAQVAADREARALLVIGNGKSFCAGADLPDLFGEVGSDVGATRRHLHQVYESFLGLRRLQVPTIAAVHGAAVGAGLNLAMSCDVRVAGPHASFAATFTKIGLHPGGGCTWFLVNTLGRERALALLLDGGALGGAEAVERGLALELAADPVARAREMVQAWAALDPALARDIKRAVTMAATGDFDATLEFESWAQASSAAGPAIQETVARFRR